MWSVSTPFQDFELSQQKAGRSLLRETQTSLKTSDGEGSASAKPGGLRKLSRTESQWYRGTWHAWEANVWFNLGLQ